MLMAVVNLKDKVIIKGWLSLVPCRISNETAANAEKIMIFLNLTLDVPWFSWFQIIFPLFSRDCVFGRYWFNFLPIYSNISGYNMASGPFW